jgi:uracil phosphoribosyltransferase
MTALASAIAPMAGAGNIVWIVNRAQQIPLVMRPPAIPANVTILPTTAIPAGTVIAAAANAIVSALGLPVFEAATQVQLHLNDAPLDIVGSGGVVAAPQLSTFQSASIAIKMTMGASWGVRSSNAVAFMTGVNW